MKKIIKSFLRKLKSKDGITFKENCPDVRNTKAVDVIRGLEDYGINVATFDPWANSDVMK